MKMLIDSAHICRPFLAEDGLALILMNRGEAEIYVAPPETTNANTLWRVVGGSRRDAAPCVPGITAQCRACDATVDMFFGPDPEKCVLYHRAACSIQRETPPQSVCREYLDARATHFPKSLTEKVVDRLQDFRRELANK